MSEHRTCVNCGRGFTLSFEEQHWYMEQGWELPKRCPACRAERRREQDSGNMGFSGAPDGLPSGGPPAWPTGFFNNSAQERVQARPSRPVSPRGPGQGRQSPPSRRPDRSSRAWWRNPYAGFGLVILAIILLAGIVAIVVGLPRWLVGLVVGLAVNVVTLVIYRYDKVIAGGERTRVPELVLHGLSLVGGWPAAFVAMYLFPERHKVQKMSFMLVYWLIVALYLVGLCGLLTWDGL